MPRKRHNTRRTRLDGSIISLWNLVIELRNEDLLLERLHYRSKNQHRCGGYWRKLEQVQKMPTTGITV